MLPTSSFRRPLAILSIAAACLWGCASSADSGADAPKEPAPVSLKEGMKRMEEDWKHIEESLKANPPSDLPGLAAAATKVAAAMHLAYDPFEDKEVPNFATFAREAEQALLQFADDARNGRAEAVAERGKSLQEQHCARCHDATEEVHG